MTRALASVPKREMTILIITNTLCNAASLMLVAPLPKTQDIEDFNKDLRAISLTSILSKIAEDFIIQNKLKLKLLKAIHPKQFGFIPGSNSPSYQCFING